jgi:glycosyltransferase involved in cell wall biosynthesis
LIYKIIFIIFLLSFAVQLFFWLGLFSRLAFFKKKPAQPEKQFLSKAQQPVSIIICAKNEAKNLQKNIPYILSQTYGDFEIIVVNDNSTDNSLEILLDFQFKFPNFTIVNLQQATLPGKKEALSAGIQKARFDIVLLTDADCRPASKNWLDHMQKALDGNIEIGLGHGPFFSKKSFLNLFIRFESIYTAINYQSFALAGLPYMGVGRNLIYRKSLFEKAGGFQKHAHLASGDDDLFINSVAHKSNTALILEPSAFVFSEAKSSWPGYYIQKTRHLTTGSSYKLTHKILLGALSASHFVFYISLIFLLFNQSYQMIALGSYLVRMTVVLWLSRRILRKLNDPYLWKFFPLFDALFIFYYLIFSPVLLTGNTTKKWK